MASLFDWLTNVGVQSIGGNTPQDLTLPNGDPLSPKRVEQEGSGRNAWHYSYRYSYFV